MLKREVIAKIPLSFVHKKALVKSIIQGLFNFRKFKQT